MTDPAHQQTADAIEIARLAALTLPDYDRERASAAVRMGIRVATLDEMVRAARPRPSNSAEVAPPDYSDDAVALRFSDAQEGDLLHVAEWGRWLRWDGARWAQDTTLAVFDLARVCCRAVASEAAAEAASNGDSGETWVAQLASAAKIAAVERLARSDRRHARSSQAFDADPWTLNTPGGVVDLRTSKMRSHRRDDLMTKLAGTTPGGECPRWLAFLKQITQDDEAVIGYLQRWAGYILTGETREHAFLFLYGPGGNGKGVFVNTLAAAIGDYATTAAMETFMVSHNPQHTTDLADLRGARLVLAQETEAGRQLAEARIKALTGGDKIKARFMRCDNFEFQPAFKLVMVGNHRPIVRNPDDAMRRRLHLLPLTFKPPKPDTDLAAALHLELPGILKWAIAGCASWLSYGLALPKAVKDATADYFAEQDIMAQWRSERCVAERDAKAPSAALFRDWKAWSEARGEPAGTNKAFSAEMQKHFAKDKTREGAMFLGVRLLPSESGVW